MPGEQIAGAIIAKGLDILLGGLGGGSGPSKTSKIREIRSVGFLYGTDSPQFRAIIAKYPNIYRYYASKFKDLPTTITADTGPSGQAFGVIRNTGRAARLVRAAGEFFISKAEATPGGWRERLSREEALRKILSNSSGPPRRYSMKGKLLDTARATMLVLGKPIVRAIPYIGMGAYILSSAADQLGNEQAANQPPQPETAAERARRLDDENYVREQRARERKLFEEHEQDRAREAKERAEAKEKASADEMQKKAEADRAAEAARIAALPAPLWLQALGLAQKYYEQQANKPQAARVSQSIVLPQPEPLPQLTGFSAGGVGSAPCECPPKKKRPKSAKRARTICYQGRYIERADGIQKSRGRRVPCRVSRKKSRS